MIIVIGTRDGSDQLSGVAICHEQDDVDWAVQSLSSEGPVWEFKAPRVPNGQEVLRCWDASEHHPLEGRVTYENSINGLYPAIIPVVVWGNDDDDDDDDDASLIAEVARLGYLPPEK